MSEQNETNATHGPTTGNDPTEILKWTLDGVQEQIRFADSKAAFVVLFHTFLFGFLITQAEHLAAYPTAGRDWFYCMRIGVLTAYAATSIVSIAYAISAVIPKFGEEAPPCRIFFGSIVNDFQRDYARFHETAISRTPTDWLKDITSQIVENSNIALIKHQRAGIAARWAIATVTFAFLGVATLFGGGAVAP